MVRAVWEVRWTYVRVRAKLRSGCLRHTSRGSASVTLSLRLTEERRTSAVRWMSRRQWRRRRPASPRRASRRCNHTTGLWTSWRWAPCGASRSSRTSNGRYGVVRRSPELPSEPHAHPPGNPMGSGLNRGPCEARTQCIWGQVSYGALWQASGLWESDSECVQPGCRVASGGAERLPLRGADQVRGAAGRPGDDGGVGRDAPRDDTAGAARG